MYAITDVIFLTLIIFFFVGGWKKGIFRSLIGPGSFAICSLIAILYFDVTQNIVMSIIIVSGGTLLLSLLAIIIHMIGRRTVDKEHRDYVFWGSRLLGSIINTAWEGAVILLSIVLVTLLPGQIKGIAKVQNDIYKSTTYHLTNYHIISQIPVLRNIIVTLAIFQDANELAKLSQTPEFQDFFLDERIQAIITDDEVIEQIKKKKFQDLATNPKIQVILSDHKLMQKLTKLSKRIYLEKAKENKK